MPLSFFLNVKVGMPMSTAFQILNIKNVNFKFEAVWHLLIPLHLQSNRIKLEFLICHKHQVVSGGGSVGSWTMDASHPQILSLSSGHLYSHYLSQNRSHHFTTTSVCCHRNDRFPCVSVSVLLPCV